MPDCEIAKHGLDAKNPTQPYLPYCSLSQVPDGIKRFGTNGGHLKTKVN
jgi:hypothetical protein